MSGTSKSLTSLPSAWRVSTNVSNRSLMPPFPSSVPKRLKHWSITHIISRASRSFPISVPWTQSAFPTFWTESKWWVLMKWHPPTLQKSARNLCNRAKESRHLTVCFLSMRTSPLSLCMMADIFPNMIIKDRLPPLLSPVKVKPSICICHVLFRISITHCQSSRQRRGENVNAHWNRQISLSKIGVRTANQFSQMKVSIAWIIPVNPFDDYMTSQILKNCQLRCKWLMWMTVSRLLSSQINWTTLSIYRTPKIVYHKFEIKSS